MTAARDLIESQAAFHWPCIDHAPGLAPPFVWHRGVGYRGLPIACGYCR